MEVGVGWSLPFFERLEIGRGRGAHELGHEVAEDADQYHDDGERNQHPVTDRGVQHKVVRHG